MLEQILAKLTPEEKTYLKKVCERDELTKVYNRFFFNRKIEEEVHRAEFSGKDVTLLIVDINDFKKYQDSHPNKHLEGDRVLKQIAQFLDENTKDFDTVCRYGGDEFAVICPETDLEKGKEIAERLRKYIEMFSPPITVSIGIANYKGNAQNVVELLYKADQALYKANKLGKNRCEVFTDDEATYSYDGTINNGTKEPTA
jgi:diguanylate cyclase (GGDEF)-like protein